MWKKISLLLIVVTVVVACKEQPPIVLEDPISPPEPSIHIIDNYYYVQFTSGKFQDTHTYEVLDDTNSWTELSYVNYVYENRDEFIYDTTLAEDLDDYDERLKVGYHYSPTTTILKRRLFFIENTDVNNVYTIEEIAEVDDDYFSISFPYHYDDTFKLWDIEDYLENPSIEEGIIPWGREGNNKLTDTLWNINARNGVVISYTDTAGEEWRSDNHPNFQPYGYFQINEHQANYRDKQSYDIIQGEFAVRLYNDKQTYKDLRYGRFRLRILGDIKLRDEPE